VAFFYFNLEVKTMGTNRLEQYQKRLDAYYDAEMNILNGAQSYQIGTRTLTRADLKEVKDTIEYLERAIDIEKSKNAGKGRNKVIGIIPRDV